ncbi:MAG: M56 family metallopeptidase [Pseudomonadales bacterium]|nr:M56 family metallopeptidase [Pseudomonadales bacterium]
MTWIAEIAALVQPGSSDVEMLLGFADILLKSGLIVLLAHYLELDSSPFFSSSQKRLLWLVALFIILVLPVSSFVFARSTGIGDTDPRLALLVLEVTGSSATLNRQESAGSVISTVVLTSYFLVAASLMLRLMFSMRAVKRLRSCTDFDVPEQIRQRFRELCRSSGIQRQISLGTNPQLSSPVTYGIRQPVVALPDADYFLSDDLFENAILHELGHIRRHDTLLFLITYFLAALNWFNPFVWYALNRLDLSAEQACDDEVIAHRGDRIGFARQLLELARVSMVSESLIPAGRGILRKGQLTNRVRHILESDYCNQSNRNCTAIMPLLVLGLAFVLLSAARVVMAGEQNWHVSENLRLIHYQNPVYPAQALERGLSGFSQYQFDVNELGRIIPESVQLLRSSHGPVFDRVSEQSLQSFQFAPRIVHGRSVASNGIKYTFNFTMRI